MIDKEINDIYNTFIKRRDTIIFEQARCDVLYQLVTFPNQSRAEKIEADYIELKLKLLKELYDYVEKQINLLQGEKNNG